MKPFTTLICLCALLTTVSCADVTTYGYSEQLHIYVKSTYIDNNKVRIYLSQSPDSWEDYFETSDIEDDTVFFSPPNTLYFSNLDKFRQVNFVFSILSKENSHQKQKSDSIKKHSVALGFESGALWQSHKRFCGTELPLEIDNSHNFFKIAFMRIPEKTIYISPRYEKNVDNMFYYSLSECTRHILLY